MTTALLEIQTQGRVRQLILDRPGQGNAVSAELVAQLNDALDSCEQDGIEALTLEGRGRNFCTGFDLSELDTETDDTLLARFVRIELLLQRFARAPFLTVAIARGRAMGAGADLFAACRLRLVDGEASFSFPGARGFGLVLGTRRLASIVGADTALEWVESACAVAIREAQDTGLVSQVVTGTDEIAAAMQRQMLRDSATGHALRQAVEPLAEQHDARDLELLVRSAATPGLRNRIAAYIEQNKSIKSTHSIN